MENFLSFLQEELQPKIDEVLNHPFFERLGSGNLTKNQVQKFALDYNFYCQCFPQLLGFAAAKIIDDETRMPIITNLWEEHGEGDILKSHRRLYINFLKSLDVADEDIIQSKPSKSTKLYINSLINLCNKGDFLEILGIIGPGTEYFASNEFKIIYDSLSKYNFGRDIDLEYWSIHIDIDDHHSSETLEVIKPFLNSQKNQNKVLSSSLKAVELEIYFWDEMNNYIK